MLTIVNYKFFTAVCSVLDYAAYQDCTGKPKLHAYNIAVNTFQ